MSMVDLDRVTGFCMKQKSITEVMDNFITSFLELYRSEGEAEQELLAQCVRQMFRKYYYSILLSEEPYTPSCIVNTLCEREFGGEIRVVPRLQVNFKGKKIRDIRYEMVGLQPDQNPFVEDMEFFLQAAKNGLKMEYPGITDAKEYKKLKEKIFVFDRHYINILGLVGMEAGYLECSQTFGGFLGRTTPKADEFLNMDPKKKLNELVHASIRLCSKNITGSFPELQKEYSVIRMNKFLMQPEKYEGTTITAIKKMGINPEKLASLLTTGIPEDMMSFMSADELEGAVEFASLQKFLDMFFITPLSFYLHLIQPVYPEVYIMEDEFATILEDPDDFTETRNKLFSPAAEFDLTAAGERVLNCGKPARRNQAVPMIVGDDDLHGVVLKNQEFVRQWLAESDMEAFNELMKAIVTPKITAKGEDGKGTKPRTARNVVSKAPNANQVFDFKVKVYEAKRCWRRIEVLGSQTLHHLHQAIMSSFCMDDDHLYSFFLINKFWDRQGEYAHPAANAHSAAKVKINQLQLQPKQKFLYLYDYGDEYRFEVELMAVGEKKEKAKYPREAGRSKPLVSSCQGCGSEENPVVWFCVEHEEYLCEACAQSEEHGECYLTTAIV